MAQMRAWVWGFGSFGPNVDPIRLQSFKWDPPKGTPNIGKLPFGAWGLKTWVIQVILGLYWDYIGVV